MSDVGPSDPRRVGRAQAGPGSFGFDPLGGSASDRFAANIGERGGDDYEDDLEDDAEGLDDEIDSRFGGEDGLGARVRPYAITGGRTRSVGGDLPVESLVLRTPRGAALLHELTLERRHIVQLCERPLSVAELSAHVGVHLGVTQVLLGDLTAEGLVRVHSSKLAEERPDIVLLERVLHGLKAL